MQKQRQKMWLEGVFLEEDDVAEEEKGGRMRMRMNELGPRRRFSRFSEETALDQDTVDIIPQALVIGCASPDIQTRWMCL